MNPLSTGLHSSLRPLLRLGHEKAACHISITRMPAPRPCFALSASRAASLKGWSGGRITEAERTRWCARSTPGG